MMTPQATTRLSLTLPDLPSEVIQQILFYLPPPSLVAILQTSKRLRLLAVEPLLWRHNCLVTFAHWRPLHDLASKLLRPAVDVDWYALFSERWKTSRRTRALLDEIIASQPQRIEKIEAIAEAGYDAKDDLLEQASTSEDADDWLARRWWSEAALSLVHRRMAIEVWMRVARNDPDVTLEEALGAFDVFTLGTRRGDINDTIEALDALAQGLREEQPNIDEWPTRRKALALVTYLRKSGYQGVDEAENYHAIQNNFIGFALQHEKHQTLPIILVSIYICLARRFGIEAHASNVPMHIYGLVKAPAGKTLDGETAEPGSRQEEMFIDPFRHDNEVPQADVRSHLYRIGIPDAQFEEYTSTASIQDLVIRTTRNIMTSAQQARERDLAEGHAGGSYGASWASYTPLLDESFYAALWALLIVQTMPIDISQPLQAAHLAARRARMLPLLLENMQGNCPWDVCLLEEFVLPMLLHGTTMDGNGSVFVGHEHGIRRMSADRQQLVQIMGELRKEDRIRKPPQPRPKPPPEEPDSQRPHEEAKSWGSWLGQWKGWEGGSSEAGKPKVQYKIGSLFRHRRYGYEGVIVGWDPKCAKDEGWISQMGVNRLPGGRNQSFYHVLAADKSARYVAEENIELTGADPSPALMMLAGRYFKRWDGDARAFVSNIRDEYPDD